MDLSNQEMVNPSKTVRSEGSKARSVRDGARKCIIKDIT